jgi:DNA modification methylase
MRIKRYREVVIRCNGVEGRFIHADNSLFRTPKESAVIMDPPYGIGKAWGRTFHGSRGASPLWKEGKERKWDTVNERVPIIAMEAATCVIWGGNFYPLPPSRCWFVWDKLQTNRGADCELAWVKADLAPKVFRMSRIDAYVNKATVPKIHPTQKPIPLIEWCIDQLNLPCSCQIWDPFMGSGTTGIASLRKGHPFVGIENDRDIFEAAIPMIRKALC